MSKVISFRQQFIRDPIVAKSRKEIADLYRVVRKSNPAMGRLLYYRVRGAYAMLSKHLFEYGGKNAT